MVQISLIAAIDEMNGLGKNNQLLAHLPADLQHFKHITMGKPIVMGRKTFESIGKPLPGRVNIVLSRQPTMIDGVTLVHSLDEAFTICKAYHEICIIGGAEVFIQAMPFATCLELTHIHHCFEADVFFPKIDPQMWRLQKENFRSQDEKNHYSLTFSTYQRIFSS